MLVKNAVSPTCRLKGSFVSDSSMSLIKTKKKFGSKIGP